MNSLLIKLFQNHMDITNLMIDIINDDLNFGGQHFYLSVKWKVMEQVCAVKLDAVSLNQSDLILTPFKDFSLINIQKTSSFKSSFSGDKDCAFYIFQCYGFIWISVLNRELIIQNWPFCHPTKNTTYGIQIWSTSLWSRAFWAETLLRLWNFALTSYHSSWISNFNSILWSCSLISMTVLNIVDMLTLAGTIWLLFP